VRIFISYSFGDDKEHGDLAKIKDVVGRFGHVAKDGAGRVGRPDAADRMAELVKRCDALISIQRGARLSPMMRREMEAAIDAKLPVIRLRCVEVEDDYAWGTEFVFENDISSTFHDLGVHLHRMHRDWLLGTVDEDQEVPPDDLDGIAGRLSSLGLLDRHRHRTNFDYHALLKQHDDPALSGQFYRAEFTVSFTAVLPTTTNWIVEARTAGTSFSRSYKSALRDERGLYRYVMKVPDSFLLQPSHFVVTDFFVNSQPLMERGISVKAGYRRMKTGGRRVVHQFRNPLTPEQQLRPSKVELKIVTMMRKDQNEFTMIFGYPVKDLNTTFMTEGTDITNIEVVDVLTSRDGANKEPMAGPGLGARAWDNGWILPESAVIYVWQRQAGVA